MELAVTYFPSDAPITKHVLVSYQKHHAPIIEVIPESHEVHSNIKVVKALEGVSVQKDQPCIRADVTTKI